MGAPRGTETTMLSGRAQSTLIGIVLLIGIVAIGSLGIFLVASDMLTDVEQESEHDRVENSFVELSQQMATASSDDDVSRSVDIDVGEDGAVVMSNTGNLTIKGGDVDKTIPIGAIEYTGDDGTKIAYQAGGVFRETGNQTRVVSAPPINYDADSETLSFPIIKTRDEAHLDSGNIHVSHHKTDPLQEASLVENDSVTIEVESAYYRGWEAYFREQGGPTAVRNVDAFEENESGVVTAEFGYLDIEDAFNKGITADSFDTEGSVDTSEIDFTTKESTPQELDEVIDEIIEEENKTLEGDEYENRNWAEVPETDELIIDGSEDLSDISYVDEEGVFPSGTYYADGVDLDNDLTFDLSEGDATLVVDGDMIIQGQKLEVTNWENSEDHTLRIYLSGNLDMENQGGTMCVESCMDEESGSIDSSQLMVLGKSDTSFAMQGGTFEGLFYAGGAHSDFDGNEVMDEEEQVYFQSNPDFYGSIVASSVGAQGGKGSITLKHDENLEDADLALYSDDYSLPPQLTYLNVAEHKVDVEGN